MTTIDVGRVVVICGVVCGGLLSGGVSYDALHPLYPTSEVEYRASD
jgi:hypothetical protein